MKNVERFLNAYATIEKELKKIAGETRYMKLYQLLEKAGKNNSVVKNNAVLIQDYADLRNAIVHQRDGELEYIADPSDAATESIEHIASLLASKENILHFASMPVKVATLEDSLIDVYNEMIQLHTTKIPVYENDRFVNLVTMEMIAKAAISQDYSVTKEAKVKDVISSIAHQDRVMFMGKNRGVHDVIDVFTDSINAGINLLAIIVSENGNLREKPLGIITVFDLPKIVKYFG